MVLHAVLRMSVSAKNSLLAGSLQGIFPEKFDLGINFPGSRPQNTCGFARNSLYREQGIPTQQAGISCERARMNADCSSDVTWANSSPSKHSNVD